MEIQLRSCVHSEITVLLLICGEPLNPQALFSCAGTQVHFWMMSIDTFISSKQDKDEKVNAEISDFPHKFPILWDFLAEMDRMKEFYQNLALTCYAVHSVTGTHMTPFCLICIVKILCIMIWSLGQGMANCGQQAGSHFGTACSLRMFVKFSVSFKKKQKESNILWHMKNIWNSQLSVYKGNFMGTQVVYFHRVLMLGS